MPPSTISIGLAAARQAAAIGAYPQKAPAPAPPSDAGSPPPVTPAKPAGTGLLIDRRV